MSKLCFKSIKELHNLLVSKKIKVSEILEETLKTIDKNEPEIEAFITITAEEALNKAKILDEKVINIDNWLEGIPIAIKDNIITKNVLTTAGSKMLSNFKPIYDATVMKNIYKYNMILVGKTNMDEFAMGGSTETSYFKKTKNALDQSKVPGGSSGGSAAAVASGEVPVSLGTDTGGSIRQPASFNGIVGMKPTYGRVSRFGLIAFASSLDQIGPLTRTVKDNALVLSAISGFDLKDGTSSRIKVPDFSSGLDGKIKGLKIGFPKEYLDNPGIDQDVKSLILKAAKTLCSLGAEVEEVNLPYSKYAVEAYYIISSAEASSNLNRFDGIRYGYRSKNINNLQDIYINSRSEGFGKEVKNRIMLGTFVLSSGCYDKYFKKAGKVRTLIKRDFENVFSEYDLIMGPSTPTVAYEINEKINDPISMYTNDLLTIPINLAGLPAISIPAGFSKGMPVGLQLIGKPFDEHLIYKVAYAFEKSTNFERR